MNVYVIEVFKRNDEFVEYDSEVIATYDNEKAAIQHARELVIKNSDYYGYGRVDKPEGNVKYYCCLDKDPNNEAEYADYMVVQVVEHELQSKYIKCLSVKVTERCLVKDENGSECYALRHYVYMTKQNNLSDAIREIENNFNCDNILTDSCHDEFNGECLDSEVVKYEIYEEE